MYNKVRALLLTTFAVTGLAVVSAPAAQAATYTQVGYATSIGRQVYLWRNNDNGCIHAQGKSMRNGDEVILQVVSGGMLIDDDVQRATATGVSVNTQSLCYKGGNGFRGLVKDANANGPQTGTYQNW
ncbi:hypothetical protein ACIQUM_34835 [Amycolatopsis azurea]|uniref:hypothetical protein n=1 Tax=Amycolatopsis azurea TaxID=36819 RepID=UPI0037F83A93